MNTYGEFHLTFEHQFRQMKLHYRTLGNNQPAIIILHGVFGTSDNWQTFGKVLAEEHQVFLVDQRNHGQSPHSDRFDYEAMADDLREFIDDHQLSSPVVLGHSMGGKTAMFFAVRHPDMLSKLIVVDMAPRAYPVHHQQVLAGLSAVSIDQIESRREAEEQMQPHVSDAGVRQFLLKNLKRTDQGFAWKLNLPVIRDHIEAVGEAVPSETPFEHPALFVSGSKSDYVQEKDQSLIHKIFPQAQHTTVADAGHWIHAEQPEALLNIVRSFLAE